MSKDLPQPVLVKKEVVGEELGPGDLTPRTVVILRAIHRPDVAVTAWVDMISPDVAAFFMGVTNTTLFLRIENGKFLDNNNHRIYVHRYKGEA